MRVRKLHESTLRLALASLIVAVGIAGTAGVAVMGTDGAQTGSPTLVATDGSGNDDTPWD